LLTGEPAEKIRIAAPHALGPCAVVVEELFERFHGSFSLNILGAPG